MSIRRRSRRSGLKWGLLGLALLAAVYGARLYSQRTRAPVYPPNAFHEVRRGDLLISVTEDGALRALNETVVRSALEGLNRIIHLVPEGTHVTKGELIVELDSSALKERLNEQELQHQERLFQLLQARGNLQIQKSLGESQIKDAELRVENAESDLEKYRDGDAPLLIRTVEARSGVLAEQVRIASERHARTQELFQSGNATRSELEADSLTLRREQLALSQYQEDLRLIRKYDQPNQVRLLEARLLQARGDLDRLRQRVSNEIAQAEADLKTSERAVELIEESIESQQRRLANAKIFAPHEGLVVHAAVSPFQSMGGGGEMRRDESRFRGGRGGPGGGDNREFRGGGGRSGRSGEGGPGSSLSSGSSSGSGVAQTVASANQRIASAVSGAPAGPFGGGGGGGGGGSDIQSATRGFVSYPSMRSSSTRPSAGGSGAASSGSGGGGSSPSVSSGSPSVAMINPQTGLRSSSLSFGDTSTSSGFLEEGTMVRQRQELIRLPDVSKMLAEIKIHESRVRQVRPGMTAYVRIENLPHQRFKGTVRRVAPLPDAQMSWMNPELKVYPSDILIEEELPDLKPGVSARAEIIITNLSGVLSVPIQTVARLKGESVCYVKAGDGVAPVPVTTGWFNDRFVQILTGLKEGDQVLLAPVADESAASVETNSPPAAAEPAAPERPPDFQPRGEEMQRGAPGADSGEAPPERRRGRPGGGGRRSQNAAAEAAE